MNWPLSIKINRDALLPIVVALFAQLGVGETVARHVHLAVLAILRPAEATARRLIAIAALGVVVRPRAKRAAPMGPIPKGAGAREPCFRLIDPRRKAGPPQSRVVGSGPNVWFLSGDEVRPTARVEPSPDDLICARRLRRRIEALCAALKDIPAQARRLTRITAALDRPIRAMRPGRPPGHVAGGKRPIDLLLAECQELALIAYAEAQAPP